MEQKQLVGIVSYITVIGLIIAFILNQQQKDAFGSFHIRQSLGVLVSGIALSFVAMVPIVGWILAIIGSLLLLIMWLMGLLSAIKGETKPVPVLGDKFEEWFQGVV